MSTALVVIDVQNDFCTGPAVAAKFNGDTAAVESAAAGAARAVDAARAHGVEVVFVRFEGDAAYQGPSWRQRDAALGKQPKCRTGSWGAEFHNLTPAPDERVFTKRACFDAFLTPGFAAYTDPFDHLVFAGLYTDVCVDSTARTAFQKGFHITVLADCVTALRLPNDTILGFMAALYGARITTLTEEEELWQASNTVSA
ncbi:cysteine hydrolase family protein [Actinokineospora cianjurensis]|uniref:Nicotinamidase-related amidase n=1 Tax=Actinokineospora cianjurensis TaxID=585224 RepID=A0A421B2X4_9PSEU|nr:cysteine hydrolase family protein [Actinokineospora cianjurensis]RLK58727.1 nicotinamidase-related amidase [Actinokineospora cianjurensis]